jgi:hypothetical protein
MQTQLSVEHASSPLLVKYKAARQPTHSHDEVGIHSNRITPILSALLSVLMRAISPPRWHNALEQHNYKKVTELSSRLTAPSSLSPKTTPRSKTTHNVDMAQKCTDPIPATAWTEIKTVTEPDFTNAARIKFMSFVHCTHTTFLTLTTRLDRRTLAAHQVLACDALSALEQNNLDGWSGIQATNESSYPIIRTLLVKSFKEGTGMATISCF